MDRAYLVQMARETEATVAKKGRVNKEDSLVLDANGAALPGRVGSHLDN